MTLSRNLRHAALAFMLWSLAYNLTAPLLPLLAAQLGASAVQVGIVGAAGALGAVVLTFPIAFLADRTGHRTALLAAWSLSVAGVLLLALADAWVALLPGVFCAMAPVAGLSTLNALALDELAPAERARGFSLLYAAAPLGALGGSALSGLMGARFGLQATALVAGISCLGAIVALLPIRERQAPAAPHPTAPTTLAPPAHRGTWAALLPRIAFAALGGGGFLLVALPGNFVVPYLRDVSQQSLVAAGLLSALLAGGQLAWSLLFAVWPRSTGWVQFGSGPNGLRFPLATLQAITVCLLANALFGLLFPAGRLLATLPALLLRGSQFTLQSLGSALLGEVVTPGQGRTARLTLFSAILGLGAAGAPVAGGWLYTLAPADPFWISGLAAAAGAGALILLVRLLPRPAAVAASDRPDG